MIDNPFFQGQLDSLEGDLERLGKVLADPALKMLLGRFNVAISPSLKELKTLRASTAPPAEQWQTLSELRQQIAPVLREALAFTGGMAIRHGGLDESFFASTQGYLQTHADLAGSSWQPVVVVGSSKVKDASEENVVEKDPGDKLVSLPLPRVIMLGSGKVKDSSDGTIVQKGTGDNQVILPLPRVFSLGGSQAKDAPREAAGDKGSTDKQASNHLPSWDIWLPPLLLHELGYYLVKYGELPFDLPSEAAEQVRSLLSEQPADPQGFSLMLPEVRLLVEARQSAASLESFTTTYARQVKRLALRQQDYLWHLAADGLAAALGGPVYAYAMLYQSIDLASPDLEGEAGAKAGRSRYLPSDLRRAAVVLDMLKRLDNAARPDPYSPGPYTPDLGFLESTLKELLEKGNQYASYQSANQELAPWLEALYSAITGIYSLAAQATQQNWSSSLKTCGVLLQNGGSHASPPTLYELVNAAWYWRARCPERTDLLERDSRALLSGEYPASGGAKNSGTPAVERLLTSRKYDLQGTLERLAALFQSSLLEDADRRAVSGRFYRLLSEQYYLLDEAVRAANSGGSTFDSLAQITHQLSAGSMQELVDDVMDFLGGVFIRQKELDQGASQLADTLLREYSVRSGVNWSARAVPGENPLFSTAVELVHIHFPDWEIWSLPLMAHEFGHIIEVNMAGIRELFVRELATIAEGHPAAGTWTPEQRQAYLARRSAHLYEFFADAFATYVQGPAFVYAALYLNFNPGEAYASRSGHPSHAERVELIFKVLEEMDAHSKPDEYTPGVYESVLRRGRSEWQGSVQAAGQMPTPEDDFHCKRSVDLGGRFFSVLERYFRLGAQYTPEDWTRAGSLAKADATPDTLADEDLRSLLAVAWAKRLRQPERQADIQREVRAACESKRMSPQ